MRRFIITATVAFLACVVQAYAKTYIVCVGLKDYPGFFNDLTVSDKDAENMANLYRRNGNSEVACLTNRQATVENVVNTMKSLYTKANRHDTVILFFSGHGEKGVFRCYDGLLRYNTITDCMKLSRSRKRFVLADACMSGSMRTNKRRSDENNDIDLMFFLSSRTSEPSREVFGLSNSVFTYYLCNGLKGHADSNGDRVITAKELFTYVSGNVINRTRRRQHPVMWGNFNDNMTVMEW